MPTRGQLLLQLVSRNLAPGRAGYVGGSEVGFQLCCSILPWQHVTIAAIPDGCRKRYGTLVLGASCGRAGAAVLGGGDGAARQFWSCAEHGVGSSLTVGEGIRAPGVPAAGPSYRSLATLAVELVLARRPLPRPSPAHFTGVVYCRYRTDVLHRYWVAAAARSGHCPYSDCIASRRARHEHLDGGDTNPRGSHAQPAAPRRTTQRLLAG